MSWLLSFVSIGIIFWAISSFIKEHLTKPLNRIAAALERQSPPAQSTQQLQPLQPVMVQPIATTPGASQPITAQPVTAQPTKGFVVED